MFLRLIPRPLKFIAILDATIWLISVPLALYVRLVDAVIRWTYERLIFIAIAAFFAQLLVGLLLGLYRGRYRFASFDEMKGLIFAVGLVSLVPLIPPFIDNSIAPRSFGLLAGGLALAFMFIYRFAFRVLREKKSRSQVGVPALIYGAGDTGAQIVQQIDVSGDSAYRPIGFIDDDPAKRLRRLSGLRVLGNRSDLKSILTSYDVRHLVLAMTNVSSDVLSEVYDICAKLNIKVSRVPSSSELIGGKVFLKDLESISEEDLIGRRAIYPDESAISRLIAGKRILITGAGGSIGSEIARQVHRYFPSDVFMLDRDESLLHALQLTLDGQGLLTSEHMILADIRDRQRIMNVFAEIKPDVVFHAAALKHLPMLEMYPEEAEKTNVQGTKNVLDAAVESGVGVFVNISTDKAVNPTSVLGHSKRAAEELVSKSADNLASKQRYLSVRFGNVLGSRGSFLEAFKYQIQRGGPLVVTDLAVKRYFMTIPEAVHLVLEASAKGANSDILILDMGRQVSIHDVARKMIERSGRTIEIKVSGLRKGEKLSEELSYGAEVEPLEPGSSILRVR
jgi:FlaA1/EpsC-like NDP-sugar epimerase